MRSKREQLRERGFVHFPDVLPARLVEALLAFGDASFGDTVASPYGMIRFNPWQDGPLLVDTARRYLAPIVCGLLEVPEILFFQDFLISKLAGSTLAIRWHQDYSYWPVDSPFGVMVWVALDDADADNGCLRYIPGTHTLGEKQPADFVIGAHQAPRSDLPPLEAEARADEAVVMPVRAGGLLVHNHLVWHMSPPNPTPRPRRAWASCWLGADVNWAPEHAPHPFNYSLEPVSGSPVRGELFPRMGPGVPG
jgi:hypothetical protein